MGRNLIRVPPNFGNWVRARRKKLQLSQQDLINKVSPYPSRRTIIKIENGKQDSFRENTLIGIAEGLEMTFEELFHVIKNLYEKVNSLKSNGHSTVLFEICDELDQYLISIIRSISHKNDKKQINQAFRDLLFSQLKKYSIDINNILQNPQSSLSKQKLINSPLHFEVAKNFSGITFKQNNKKLSIESPSLLWDCTCDKNLSNGNCKLHNSNSFIPKSLKGIDVIIEYEENSFLWRQHNGLWPPSIDSFLFYENVKSYLSRSNIKPESILDIGAGTGFLGISLANHFDSVEEVNLSDWTLSSYAYSRANHFRNLNKNISLYFHLGINTNWLNNVSKKYFDVVVCNPPYLPIIPKFNNLKAHHTVVGTELLTHVINKNKVLGETVLIQFSDLAMQEAIIASSNAEVQLVPIGISKQVPFRVSHVSKNPEYLEWLKDERGLIETSNHPHKYYHRLQTYLVR